MPTLDAPVTEVAAHLDARIAELAAKYLPLAKEMLAEAIRIPADYVDLIEGGAPRTLEGGGFIFSPLVGYELDATNNHAYLQNGTDTVSISLSAQAPFLGEHINSTLKYLLGYLEENYKEFVAGPRTHVSVNGVEGPSTDFKGLYNNELVQGRVTFLSDSDTKYITILILAFGEGRWEIEAEEAYTTFLKASNSFGPSHLKIAPSRPAEIMGIQRIIPSRSALIFCKVPTAKVNT